MKVIRNDLVTVEFNDIRIGEAFLISGENDIYIKTAYVHDISVDETRLTSNCINIEHGTYFKCAKDTAVYPVKAKIVIERE